MLRVYVCSEDYIDRKMGPGKVNGTLREWTSARGLLRMLMAREKWMSVQKLKVSDGRELVMEETLRPMTSQGLSLRI